MWPAGFQNVLFLTTIEDKSVIYVPIHRYPQGNGYLHPGILLVMISNLFLMTLSKKQKKQRIEKNAILFSILHIHCITHIIVYNHQILCKCIISYHTIAVRSSKLLFLFYPGVNGLAGVRCYLHPGN